MSKCCCKYAKWFPHNWLCLKGLSIFFTVMFYLSGVLALIMIEEVIRNAGYMPTEVIIQVVIRNILGPLFFAAVFLAVAKALKAIRAIKQAVAPCTCTAEKEPVKEEAK